VISRIISGTPDHLNVAFVHPMEPGVSPWVRGHDLGRQHLEQTLGAKVSVRSYYNASNGAMAEEVLEQAVAEGAEVVFTTTPQLSRSTLRAAVKYPKVRFLNCTVDTPYTSIRTYYSRIYEAKFITGAIAGAMANNDRIGYIGTAPIYGVPASINAFALGAQLTNPRAKVILRWSCQAGSAQRSLLQAGVQVISNRDVPSQAEKYPDFHNYGTYAWDDVGNPEPIGSPVWLWGKFYENVIKSILAGTWDKDKDSPRAVNYWWGMDSGVIDVELSDSLPDGLKALAQILCSGLRNGTVDPFRRRIVAQDGTVMNDGSRSLTPEELLRMDWLCDNVEGTIPEFEELEPFAQPMVRQLGVYRERIPMEKEGTL
jgi:basic membrane lipoprotein Med (substrate-binding protein (PBP1-ABC) superfamily)